MTPLGWICGGGIAALLLLALAERGARQWIRRRARYYVWAPGTRRDYRISPDVSPLVEARVRFERQHLFLPSQSRAASPDFPGLYPAGSYPYINLYTWNRTVPRAGLAWSMTPKSVIKTTIGLYNYMIGEASAFRL